MAEFLRDTIHLYKDALHAAVHSFVRGWLIIVAVIVLAVALEVVVLLASPLGMPGGFLIGAANAFAIGATLALVERAVFGQRPLRWSDLPESAGHYFWEVISVGFLVWFPLLILQMALQANPYRQLLVTAVFFLVFVLLNPVPELIYQGRQEAATDIVRKSYEFVVEHWIEWFLPLGVLLAPLGLTFFFEFSSASGMRAGLDFFSLLTAPLVVMATWLEYLGISSTFSQLVVLIVTPVLAVLLLLFRGHLFHALSTSSRRQRRFRAHVGGRS